ncbi:aromatic acid exporter family protein [Evansella sp. AB-rgal1]|uniref:aromatic acid exporter family protein n=1 Tax=Evansella sp. AB-rgal1 TaxID=3242696 RepID=UPI00359E7B6F
MFKIGYRTLKTALGAAIAIAIAQAFQLEFFASAGIITILCIHKTRRKSFQLSYVRFLACSIGLFYAAILFELIGYHPISLAVLLLMFIPTTVLLKAQEGIVTSCVIILHIYASGYVSVPLIMNEFALISIGIGCALLMNAYMPSVERELQKQQQQIERLYAKIFHEFAIYIKYGDRQWDGKEITEAASLLNSAKNIAIQNLDNHILRYEDQYYHYFKMREKQLEIIERMMPLLAKIEIQVRQGEMIGNFMEELSGGVTPKNTAGKYIDKLEQLRNNFDEMPLPETRMEFEARSSLFYLVYEMEQYLLIKQQFKPIQNYSVFR